MTTIKTKVKAGQYLIQSNNSPLTGEVLKVGRNWILSIGNIEEQFKTLKEAIEYFNDNCGCVELPSLDKQSTSLTGIKMPFFTLADYRQALINKGFIKESRNDFKSINLFVPLFIFICVFVGLFSIANASISFNTSSLNASLILDRFNNFSSFFPASL